MRLFWLVAFFLLLAAICYLSLRPSPAIATVPLVPRWLAAWFDQHDRAKNFIGFGVIGFAGLQAFGLPLTKTKTSQSQSRWRTTDVRFVVGCLAVIVGLEIVQKLIPRRTCDWRDVVAGGLGVIGAAITTAAIRGVRRALNVK